MSVRAIAPLFVIMALAVAPLASAQYLGRNKVQHDAILELDFVRPFDRPGRGWMWQFNLTPGF